MSNSNYADGDDVFVKGDDGTVEGANITATTDGSKKRLDVSSSIDSIPAIGGFLNVWNKKLRYEDMNASSGGVARGTGINTAWVKVYEYSATGGYLAAFMVNVETKDKWYFRLVIDNEEIFGASGIFSEDLHGDAVYDFDDSGKTLNEMEDRIGIMFGSHDRLLWTPPSNAPMLFSSSVKIYIKRTVADGKKFRAGLAILQKGL